MTKNVRDTALLMDVIAGSDGIDDRQPTALKPGSFNNAKELDAMLTESPEAWLKGVKVGIVREGFMDSCQNPTITKLVKSAACDLTAFGAEVSECSIPLHLEAARIWMCGLPLAGMRQGLLADATGRKQLYLTPRTILAGKQLSQAAFDSLGPGGQNIYLRGLFLEEKYGPSLQSHCYNLLRKVNVCSSFVTYVWSRHKTH
jgi:amidase